MELCLYIELIFTHFKFLCLHVIILYTWISVLIRSVHNGLIIMIKVQSAKHPCPNFEVMARKKAKMLAHNLNEYGNSRFVEKFIPSYFLRLFILLESFIIFFFYTWIKNSIKIVPLKINKIKVLTTVSSKLISLVSSHMAYIVYFGQECTNTVELV